MKTRWHIIIACLLFVVIAVLAYVIRNVKTPQFAGVACRPEEFPDALVAPSHAEDVYYECRSVNEKMPAGIYSLRFSVAEVFPGKRARDEISQRLEAQGWRRLTYCLMTPQYAAPTDWAKSKRRDFAFRDMELGEHWSNLAEEVISLVYTYRIVGKEEAPVEPLYVNQTFYSPNAWIHKFVAAYREMHPEELPASADVPSIPDAAAGASNMQD